MCSMTTVFDKNESSLCAPSSTLRRFGASRSLSFLTFLCVTDRIVHYIMRSVCFPIDAFSVVIHEIKTDADIFIAADATSRNICKL